MCFSPSKWKCVREEKESVSNLYEFDDEKIRKRIQTAMEWYIEKAAKYKRYFCVFGVISIVLPLAITILNSINILPEWQLFVKNLITILSVAASMISSFLTFFKFQEKWLLYRNTVEEIKKELVLYAAEKTGDEELINLVVRIEEYMKKERAEWIILSSDMEGNSEKREKQAADYGGSDRDGEAKDFDNSISEEVVNMEAKELLMNELKKHKLCRWYWSEQIINELGKDIVLEYEPLGEMGMYSKYFDFCLPYKGDMEWLADTTAVFHLGITANSREYDIQKATQGVDCFHNVCIKVIKDDSIIITCKFRMWDDNEEEYCGSESVLEKISKAEAIS